MNSADLLQRDDRCQRSAHYSLNWDSPRLTPNEVLRRAVDEGLVSFEDDPGDLAGSRVMELFSMRQIETKQCQLYDLGLHFATLADILVTVLRKKMTYERPEDGVIGNHAWTSGAWLDGDGTRLRVLRIVDRMTEERLASEKHSWSVIGEHAAYGMPVTMTVVVIGQQRDGKHLSPWARGYLHTVGTQNLRFRKRDGSGLAGAGWKSVYREEADHLSRDKWIDSMQADGVMQDVMFDVDIPLLPKEALAKIKNLAEKKLNRIHSVKETPELSPSQCDWPTPCGYRLACWQFQKPSERLGFLPVTGLG